MLGCINAVKVYDKKRVLNNVDITCNTGEITGIIGRNGAGKTVLFKALCGLITLDEGKVLFDDKEKPNGKMLEDVGVIIEEPAFLGKSSGLKNLEYLYMIKHKLDRKHLKSVLEKVGLDPDSSKKVEKYSLGMRQRLAIAQAIMENPKYLILDEPFNGLDNNGVQEIRKLLLEMKQMGKTILVASHNPEDINILCDKVYRMDGGVLI